MQRNENAYLAFDVSISCGVVVKSTDVVAALVVVKSTDVVAAPDVRESSDVVEAPVVVRNTEVVEAPVVVVAPLVIVVVTGLSVVVPPELDSGTLPTICQPNFPSKVLLKVIVDPGTLEETEKRFQYMKVPLPVPLDTVSASLPARFANPM